MKRSLYIFAALILLASFSTKAKEKEMTRCSHYPNGEVDEEAAIVLSTFAGMIGHFAEIVKDPHNEENPNNVAVNLLGIGQGIVNIFATAVSRGIQIAKDFREKVAAIILSKVKPPSSQNNAGNAN